MTAVLVSAVFLTGGCASGRATTGGVRATVPVDAELNRIADAVTQVLPAGVRLLSVRRDGESVVLDFSDALLTAAPGGVLEDTLHRVLTAASSSRTSRPRVEDYRILINGVPLERQIP